MPRKRMNRRRPRRRRKQQTNQLDAIARPLGQKYKFTTRYCDVGITMNPGVAGAVATYMFRASDLYDPNVTSTGHQPIGFDQIMQFFDHFTVIGSRIRVTYTNNDTTYEQIVGIHVADNATALADVNLYIENGNTNYKVLAKGGSGGATKTVSHRCNPPKFLSISDPLDSADLKGSTSASPAENVFYHLFVAPTQYVDSGTVNLHVQIDYIAMLTEPKSVIGS